MRIARIGAIGSERPVVIEGDEAIFVDTLIKDWSREDLEKEFEAMVTQVTLAVHAVIYSGQYS